jgi:hypothetical protein
MSVQPVRGLEIGHWVIVSDGFYFGRRAQIVGRYRDTLRLLINGGPRRPVRINVADVQRETTGMQPRDRLTTPWLEKPSLTARQGRQWRFLSAGMALPNGLRSIFGGWLDRWRRPV